MMGTEKSALFDADKFALVPVKAIREEIVRHLRGPNPPSLAATYPRDKEWACCLVTLDDMPTHLRAVNHAGDLSDFIHVEPKDSRAGQLLAHYVTTYQPRLPSGELGEVELHPFPARSSPVHPYFLIANALPKFRKAVRRRLLTPRHAQLYLELNEIELIWELRTISAVAPSSFPTASPPPSNHGDDSESDSNDSDDFVRYRKRGKDSDVCARPLKRSKMDINTREALDQVSVTESSQLSPSPDRSGLFIDEACPTNSQACSSVASYPSMKTPSLPSSESIDDPPPSCCAIDDLDAAPLYDTEAIRLWIQAVDLAEPHSVLERRRVPYAREKARRAHKGDWRSYHIDISHDKHELWSSTEWAMYWCMASLVDPYP